MFLLFFYLIWKDWVLCLHTLKEKGSKPMLFTLKNLFGGLGFILEFFKMVLRREERPQDIE